MIDAFRIGVALQMTTNASGVLNLLMREVTGLNTALDLTRSGLTGVKVAVAGLAGMTIGRGMLDGLGKMVEHGQDLIHQQAVLRIALGNTAEAQETVADASRAAWEATRTVPGTTVEGNLHTVGDLSSVFGKDAQGFKEAVQVMPAFQRMAQVLADVGNKVADAGGGQAFMAARALELRGALNGKDGKVNIDEMMHELDLMTRVEVAYQGRVDPQKYLAFIQQARAAGITLGNDALFGSIPALIMALGGNRAGTAELSGWQAAVSGRMYVNAAQELKKFGLLQGDIPKTTFGGALTQGVINSKEFGADPVQWVQDTLLPALRSHGVTDVNEQVREISRLFTRSTAAGLLQDIVNNLPSILRQEGNIKQVPASGLSGAFHDQDPTQATRDLTSAFSNMLTALGSPLVKPAMEVMQFMTDAMNRITKLAADHPDAVRVTGEVLAGLGGFLVVAGGVAITGTALAFLMSGGAAFVAFMSGVAAMAPELIAAAAALKAINWQREWHQFKHDAADVEQVWRDITKDFEEFVKFFRITGNQINDIWKSISSHLPNLGGSANPDHQQDGGAGLHHQINYRGGVSGGSLIQRAAYSATAGAGGGCTIVVHSHLELDGREIAHNTVSKLVQAWNAPLNDLGSFDQRRSYQPVAA